MFENLLNHTIVNLSNSWQKSNFCKKIITWYNTYDGDSISIDNAAPMDNEEGLKTRPYHYTLTNSCSTKTKYYVILNVKNNSFSPNFVSVSFNGAYAQTLGTMKTNTLSNTIDDC